MKGKETTTMERKWEVEKGQKRPTYQHYATFPLEA
jgi:hypothetical protein